MSRIAASARDLSAIELRRRYVPLASTVAAMLLILLPIVTTAPLLPDFGFLVLVAWRLLRPEIWSPTLPLPLGFVNDLVAGHPLGQSMALWTTLFLLLEMLDAQLTWRDYWMDWLIAAAAISFYTFGCWYVAHLMGSRMGAQVMLPQLGMSILAYPLVARLVLALDRWRLRR